LLNKVSRLNPDVYQGSRFIDSSVLKLPARPQPTSQTKIGLHLHLTTPESGWELYKYLEKAPFPLDLFITTSSPASLKILKVIFAPYGSQVQLILTPEGRGAADSWWIEMREFQSRYDIFGSIRFVSSADLRRYLLENLISPEAMRDIVDAFNSNEKIGVIYPPMYKGVFDDFNNSKRSPLQEEELIAKILEDLKIPQIANRNETVFPSGSMFWYRPAALQKLFAGALPDGELTKSHGSLSRAIERLPSHVAASAGYQTKFYLAPEYLSKMFYQSSYGLPERQNIPMTPKAVTHWLVSRLKKKIKSHPLMMKVFRAGGFRRVTFYYTVFVKRLAQKVGLAR